jgi:hypothetical protein
MHESELDPILKKDLEIEESLDPEIVTEDSPLVDRKEREPQIEDEVEDLEDVEASL